MLKDLPISLQAFLLSKVYDPTFCLVFTIGIHVTNKTFYLVVVSVITTAAYEASLKISYILISISLYHLNYYHHLMD